MLLGLVVVVAAGSTAPATPMAGTRSWSCAARSCSSATGDPADGNPLDTPVEDLSLGVEFVVRRMAGSNRWAVIGVRAARADNTP
jgi:hypothetical protein